MPLWKQSTANAASSRLSAFKGYLGQQDFTEAISRQLGAGRERAGNFKDWAGQKISKGYGQDNGTEKIALFPGWGARRYAKISRKTGQEEEPFEVDVYVSGFATSHRSPELASRSQRAFIRLAKGFAALPKLDGELGGQQDDPAVILTTQPMSRSTEELLQTIRLPPRPNDITEDYEVEALERQFQNLTADDTESIRSRPPSSRSSSMDLSSNGGYSDSSPLSAAKSSTTDELRKLHANLESRLQPFWSSVMPNRTVRLRLFASPHHIDDPSVDNGPVSTRDVVTAPDGSFQARFSVEWQDLCNHPGALHIAFGDPLEEHELLVTAELLPSVSPMASASSSTSDVSTPVPRGPARDRDRDSRVFSSTSTSDISTPVPRGSARERERDSRPSAPPTTLPVFLTHSPLRVISDIDDTVKYSNVTGGARAVFHNVFVKELKDLVIPGMGEWYSEMWKRGARFHYVSNGPFELLPLIGEFFQISQLPPGSVKLRSYAGKSLFSGLLSAPSARKRAGVLEILDAFPDSKFILVGDSGEQDLELYTELARERTSQVLAIFIRDTGEGEPLSDPTGDGFDSIANANSGLRSAPPTSRTNSTNSTTTTTTPKATANTIANANANADDTPRAAPQAPSRKPTPLNTAYSYVARAKRIGSGTPVSGGPNSAVSGGPKSADYFSFGSRERERPLTAEPEALISFDEEPRTPCSSHTATTPVSASASAYSSYPAAPSYPATPSHPATPSYPYPASAMPLRSAASNASFSSMRSTSTTATVARMSDAERRRYELQMRLYRARAVIPFMITLRLFREPQECVETWGLLESHFGG